MSLICQTVIDAMEKLAPANLAAGWDNVGLLAGDPNQVVNNVIVTLDVTWESVEKASTVEKTMIISHHPVIFKPISTLRSDLPLGKILCKIVKNDLAVYAAHTNLDIAPGGINDILSEKLGVLPTASLENTFREKLYKIIVFVPEAHLEEVRSAMSLAGAGHIGNYSGCTFNTAGTGTFRPLDGANPYIGQAGRLEYVKEHRLETVVTENLKSKVISAMLEAHPYEEVAYDEILLQNEGKKYGLGRVGNLAKPMALEDFINFIKKTLKVSHVTVAGAKTDKIVKKVAVCGGSGANLAFSAALLGADVFITGDVGYHAAQAAVETGLTVIDAGHFSTENIFIPHIADYLRKCARENNWGITVEEMNTATNIFSLY